MKWLLAVVLTVAAGIFGGSIIARSALCYKLVAHYKPQRSADIWLEYRARNEAVPQPSVNREFALLRAQFGDDEKWRSALRANRLCAWQLGRDVKDHLRSRAWLDRQLTLATSVSDDDCRVYFAQHQAEFVQPIRYRVAHLFLAAPPETPDEVVATKRRTIDDLAQRLKQGEQFVDLVAQFSEDEATKKRGGDLGYFSDARMPADFMAAVRTLQIGQLSDVVQTKLGFHIFQLMDTKPEHAMSFEEARPEIVAELQNAKRREAVQKVIVDLARDAEVVRE